MLFFANAYFCPGGGWNQNARFDQVRAIVEGGTFAINDYLVYRRGDREVAGLDRRSLPPDIPTDKIWETANTGDVTRHGDRVYPGKPPGTVLLAVPAYFVIHQIEKRFGMDPDDLWSLTFNAYLTRLLSVGLITALGGVAFLRLSRRLFEGVSLRGHVLGALAWGLATMLWPFGTLFFDHNIVAVLLVVAFGSLVRVGDESRAVEGGDEIGGRTEPATGPLRGPMPPGSGRRLFAAGTLLSVATVCNYLAIIPVVIFSLYALAKLRPIWAVRWLWFGGVLPALFLAWYHFACFGSVTATANSEEPMMFQNRALFLGMFGKPDWRVVSMLLVSSYRALFFLSPVLAVALLVAGLAVVMRQRRAEMLTCLAVFAAYVVMNASFQGWSKAWTGGWSFGPRYLIPGVALLALPLCAAFDRLPRITMLLAGYSFLMTLLGTAVDPQPPVSFHNPVAHYLWPLASGETVKNGRAEISGAVSANPIGVYESFYHRVFGPGSREARWNSFNVGEFLWPGRRLSLLPLLAVLFGGCWLLRRWTRINHEGTKAQR